ncbi:MAG: hypothetical protein M1409_05480 [Actinobacteria bacterium]|nr:hypothetical protein [Actinomycetota bacterium]
MKYINLREKLRNFPVFSIRDIEKIEDKKFHRRRLNEWQKKNYIKKIIKGYYSFNDLEINEEILFEIANKIYSPSYISFEIALSYYELIPESVYKITSASTKKTYSFNTPVAKFDYKKIKESLFFGYEINNRDKYSYKIASPEKTILDFFYINSHIRDIDHFENLRINKNNFFKQVNEVRLFEYLEIFGNKSLSYRIKKFYKFLEND